MSEAVPSAAARRLCKICGEPLEAPLSRYRKMHPACAWQPSSAARAKRLARIAEERRMEQQARDWLSEEYVGH